MRYPTDDEIRLAEKAIAAKQAACRHDGKMTPNTYFARGKWHIVTFCEKCRTCFQS
jgi:hypothetical protein